MQHSKERTTVHTIVLTEQEAAWLREVVADLRSPGSDEEDAFLTDLHDALTP